MQDISVILISIILNNLLCKFYKPFLFIVIIQYVVTKNAHFIISNIDLILNILICLLLKKKI